MLLKAQSMQSAPWEQSNSQGTAIGDWHGSGAEELIWLCITPTWTFANSMAGTCSVFCFPFFYEQRYPSQLQPALLLFFPAGITLCQTCVAFEEHWHFKYFSELSKKIWACCSWFGAWGVFIPSIAHLYVLKKNISFYKYL